MTAKDKFFTKSAGRVFRSSFSEEKVRLSLLRTSSGVGNSDMS